MADQDHHKDLELCKKELEIYLNLRRLYGLLDILITDQTIINKGDMLDDLNKRLVAVIERFNVRYRESPADLAEDHNILSDHSYENK